MASIEARLQQALIDLRRANGTVDVLKNERNGVSELLSEVQDYLNLATSLLSGDAKKQTLALEQRIMDWRTKQGRISL
jgi:hypothetical protein